MSLQHGNFEDRRQPNSPQNDIAGGGGPPYDSDMEARVTRLEADLAIIKIDVAVILANGATKADLAELKGAAKADLADLKGATKADLADFKSATKADMADLKSATKADIADLKGSIKAEIAEAKTTIIMWVVGAIFVAQLLPLVKDLVRPPPRSALVAPALVNTN